MPRGEAGVKRASERFPAARERDGRWGRGAGAGWTVGARRARIRDVAKDADTDERDEDERDEDEDEDRPADDDPQVLAYRGRIQRAAGWRMLRVGTLTVVLGLAPHFLRRFVTHHDPIFIVTRIELAGFAAAALGALLATVGLVKLVRWRAATLPVARTVKRG